jgi:hypothetical protein
MRDWLEQKIPTLLEYPPSDFRVHRVIPAASVNSRIPSGSDVIVIDFGDSASAPHQRKSDKVYFYRAAGRSAPAPHFYLELLRQRLTEVRLSAELRSVELITAYEDESAIFVETKLHFAVLNVGAVAAYKWALRIVEIEGESVDTRSEDLIFNYANFPRQATRPGGIRIDDTILPEGELTEVRAFGVRLRPATRNSSDLSRARSCCPWVCASR